MPVFLRKPAVAFFVLTTLPAPSGQAMAAAPQELTGESLVFCHGQRTPRCAVYWASVREGRVSVQRVSPLSVSASAILVAANGRMLWITGEGGSGRTVTTMSYPDYKTRSHPRAVPIGSGGQLAFSPNGASLAYTVWPDAHNVVIQCENLATGEIRALDGKWPCVAKLSWSPDGQQIAFYSGGLHVVDVRTGKWRQLSDDWAFMTEGDGDQRDPRSPPLWSAAGDRLFFNARFGRGPGMLYSVSPSGAEKPKSLGPFGCLGLSSKPNVLHINSSDGWCELDLPGEPPKARVLLKHDMMQGQAPEGYRTGWGLSPSGRMVAYFLLSPPKELLMIKFLDGAFGDVAVDENIGGRYHWVSAAAPLALPEDAKSKDVP
ncbi:MAG: hypothetical protein FJ290_08190 [Planctomycetes bacterium]|nr:hypothetical protein [Planctomycetota bacterium]